MSEKLFGFGTFDKINCLIPESNRKFTKKKSTDYKSCIDSDSGSIIIELSTKVSDTEEGSDEALLETSLT